MNMCLDKYRLVLGSRKNLGLLFVNYVFHIFRVTDKVNGWPIHFTNKINTKGLNIIGDDLNLVRCLVKNGNIYIQTSNQVYIHSSALLASGCKIISGNHDINNLRAVSLSGPSIEIGENCWIGANAVVLPGVKIGPRTIVGAGAIVTKSFPTGHCVVGGNPAKILRKL